MKFENTFAVEAPIDEVYTTLLDVERVAPCVPGAEVLEKTGDDTYQVAIKVRVGPISMTYRGNVEIVERDDANHHAVMRARARETRGQGTADARVDLSLDQQGETTNGTMVADVQLAGRAAAMGRGVIQDVSAKIVSTFAQNLEAMLAGRGAPAEPEAAAAAGGGGATPAGTTSTVRPRPTVTGTIASASGRFERARSERPVRLRTPSACESSPRPMSASTMSVPRPSSAATAATFAATVAAIAGSSPVTATTGIAAPVAARLR
jgi:carbon monoxide dehydrogenase subunit G